jgi:hypothetical protein
VRDRPAVEVVNYDCAPSRPMPLQRRRDGSLCKKAADALRAHCRAKPCGSLVPPARAAATESDEKRQRPPPQPKPVPQPASTAKRKSPSTAKPARKPTPTPKPKRKPEPEPEPMPKPKPKPKLVNHPSARSLPHPSGNLENSKPQHALHEAMLYQSRHRVVQPCASGADVQIISVADGKAPAAEAPVASVIFVRIDSTAWTLDEAEVPRAIRDTVARVRGRGAGGADGNSHDNAAITSDPSGGVYVNHGVSPTAPQPAASAPPTAPLPHPPPPPPPLRRPACTRPPPMRRCRAGASQSVRALARASASPAFDAKVRALRSASGGGGGGP